MLLLSCLLTHLPTTHAQTLDKVHHELLQSNAFLSELQSTAGAYWDSSVKDAVAEVLQHQPHRCSQLGHSLRPLPCCCCCCCRISKWRGLCSGCRACKTFMMTSRRRYTWRHNSRKLTQVQHLAPRLHTPTLTPSHCLARPERWHHGGATARRHSRGFILREHPQRAQEGWQTTETVRAQAPPLSITEQRSLAITAWLNAPLHRGHAASCGSPNR